MMRTSESMSNTTIIKDVFKYLILYLLGVFMAGCAGLVFTINLVMSGNISIFYILSSFVMAILFKLFANLFIKNIVIRVGIVGISDSIILSLLLFIGYEANYLGLILQSFLFSLIGSIFFVFFGAKLHLDRKKIYHLTLILSVASMFFAITDILAIFGILWSKIILCGCNMMIVFLILANFGNFLQNNAHVLTEADKIAAATLIFDHMYHFAINYARLILTVTRHKHRY